jgi:hypothetical protein
MPTLDPVRCSRGAAIVAPPFWRAGSPLVDALLAEARRVSRRSGPTTGDALAARIAARHRTALARALGADQAILALGRGRLAVDTVEQVVSALASVWRVGDQGSPLRLALLLAAERAFDLPVTASLRYHPAIDAARIVAACHGPALEAYLGAAYRLTQAWLRAHRLGPARLWRGTAVPRLDASAGLRRCAVELWPLSSWTPHQTSARSFASLRGSELGGDRELLYAEVPGSRILSLDAAWDDPHAAEVLVLGGPAEAWALSWPSDDHPYAEIAERAYGTLIRAYPPS